MIRDFLAWLQADLGKGEGDIAQSWSEALLGSLNFWGLTEGTHVLSLMLFAGTILVVDLRLLGVTFKKTPVSVLSDKILPLTIFGFGLMVVTGLLLFYAKPLAYYHNVWFRLKVVFLIVAVINIGWFHWRVQRKIHLWDTAPHTPPSVRAAAFVSITAWIVVIMLGRFMAYDWFECGKPIPAYMNALQECAASDAGANEIAALGAPS